MRSVHPSSARPRASGWGGAGDIRASLTVLLAVTAACASSSRPPGTGVAGPPAPGPAQPDPAAPIALSPRSPVPAPKPGLPGPKPDVPAAPPPETSVPGGGTSPDAHAGPASPAKESARALDELLRACEAELAQRPDDAKLREKLVLLHVMREDWPAAAQAVERLDARDDVWRLVAAALESRVGQNAQATALLEEVRRRWRAAAPLEVRRAVLCQKVNAFAQYKPAPPGRAYAPKEGIMVYLEVDNAVPDPLPSGESRMVLHYDFELLDPDGRRIPTPQWETFPRDDTRLLSGYVNDVCVPYLLYLPDGLRAGVHALRVTVSDRIGGKQASATVEVPVK